MAVDEGDKGEADANSPVDASTWRDRLPCPFLEGAAFTGRDEN
jgi:hypothetical protein